MAERWTGEHESRYDQDRDGGRGQGRQGGRSYQSMRDAPKGYGRDRYDDYRSSDYYSRGRGAYGRDDDVGYERDRGAVSYGRSDDDWGYAPGSSSRDVDPNAYSDRYDYENDRYLNRYRPHYGFSGSGAGYGRRDEDYRGNFDDEPRYSGQYSGGGRSYGYSPAGQPGSRGAMSQRYGGAYGYGNRYGTGAAYGTGRDYQGSGGGRYSHGGESYRGHGYESWGESGMERSHYGKGPKGYRKSDERLREQVSECLAESADIDASDVEVQVNSGEVTLTGYVSSRQEKRRAEDLVESIGGVTDLINQLRVHGAYQAPSSSTTSSSSKSDMSEGTRGSERSGSGGNRSSSSREGKGAMP